MKKVFVVILVITSVFLMWCSAFANEYIVTSNNKELIFTEGILCEEDMIYLPLEELLELLLINKNPNNFLRIDGDNFSLYIINEQNEDIYNMEIDRNQIVYTQEPKTYASATRETKYAPIVRNDMIYIPFEYIKYIVPFEPYNLKCLKTNTPYTTIDNAANGDVITNIFSICMMGVITVLSLLTGIYTFLRKSKTYGIIQLIVTVICPIIVTMFCALKNKRAFGGTDLAFLIHSAIIDCDIWPWIAFVLLVIEITFIFKTIYSIKRRHKDY